MRERLTFLLKTYLWTVLVFVIAKPVFMLACREGHAPLTAADAWQVVSHGLSLDLSTSLYFLILPFLLTVAALWVRVPRWVCRAYFAIVSVAFALALVADASLYPFWGFKLDASCLQYLETPSEAMASVTGGYLLARAVVLVLVSVAIYRGYWPYGSHSISAHRHSGGLRWAETLLYLLLVPVIVIGIRGGLNESTTNIGQVYYSQNQFLNHSAVNPVFSFLSSFEKTASNIVDYDFYTADECDALMQGLYPTSSTLSGDFPSDGTQPVVDTLLRSRRPDIVIVLMESAGELMAGAMPNLQRLKQQGISFDRCYANTWRTDRGTVCTYSGYPSFPTSSVMKMPSKTRLLPGIASTLRRQGYQTYYLYGGDINFTNMRSYLVATGFEQLCWMTDFTAEEQHSAEWGVRDDITFQALFRQMQADAAADASASTSATGTVPARKPRLYSFSTLSSHEPWDVPTHHLADAVPNAFNYLDRCLGQFVSSLQQSPLWDNLLVILLPDHSISYYGLDETSPARNLIPMVWLGGAVKAPRRVDVICNQTDLAATLLGQLGLPHDDFRWSRDVLSPTYRYPFAVHNFNNGFSVVDSTGFVAYDLSSNQITCDSCTDAHRLERLGKAVLQATTRDLKHLGMQ